MSIGCASFGCGCILLAGSMQPLFLCGFRRILPLPVHTLPPAVNPPFEFSGNFCAIASRFRALGSVGIYPAPAPAGAAGCSPSLMCACACVWYRFGTLLAMFFPSLIAAAPLCRLVLRHHVPPQEKRAFSFALCKRLSVLFRLLLLMPAAGLPPLR